ncbi:MAG TPA: flagellar biosynthetic protein FliO [Opitutaceae bacterium]|nr:flagellar biosynthetic protein FliO [Opitutaceae bacterium]
MNRRFADSCPAGGTPVALPRFRACAGALVRLAWTAALLAGTAALAADDNKIIFPSGSSRPASPAGGGASVANTITLIVAILLAAVGAWMYLRNRRAPGLGRNAHALAIDETRSLGNRQYLVVASYEGRKFLLGVCPGRIDLLAPLDRGGEESR